MSDDAIWSGFEAAAEQSENARLRAELAEVQRERDEAKSTLAALEQSRAAFVARSEALLERIERGAANMKANLDAAERDRDAAKAEAERLREVVERLQTAGDDLRRRLLKHMAATGEAP